MTARRLGLGALAGLAYLAVAFAAIGAGRPVLPLFDGTAPLAPYRWLVPPEGVEPATDERPLEGEVQLDLIPNSALTVITDDGQAQASVLTEDVVFPKGEKTVDARLSPLDPAAIGDPPAGLRFDSNAYEVVMTYGRSKELVELEDRLTILLRYAAHATELHRWSGTAWEPLLDATVLEGSQQIFANSDGLGIFVALGPPRIPASPGPDEEDEGSPWALWIAYGAGGLAAVGATELWLRRRRRARKTKGKPKKKR